MQPIKLLSAMLAFSCVLITTHTHAQSTLAEPYVIQGDQGRAIAANAALGSAAMQGQNKTSPQEFARREQHKAQIKACRDQYRANTRSGSPERKAARDACERTFKAQRASWKK